jgi:hypothetical protein
MYNKLFTTILDSSIWLEPTHVRIVWITLLAAMDKDGFAHFSAVGNLSGRARVKDEEAADAITILMNPDPHNQDQPNDGRRIERVPGGFLVLNAPKYRAIHDAEMQLEANRNRVANWRAKQAAKEAKRAARASKAESKALNEAAGRAYQKDVANGKSDIEAMAHANRITKDDRRFKAAEEES